MSVQPPVVNATSFNDIYILTLPSFIWVKAYSDHHGNATLPPEYDHYSASCNMVKHMSQLFVIGGTYTDTNACDLAYDAWSMHNFWTGTNNNAGNNETYWAIYNPNITEDVVPVDVYNVNGGNKRGGAKLVAPRPQTHVSPSAHTGIKWQFNTALYAVPRWERHHDDHFND